MNEGIEAGMVHQKGRGKAAGGHLWAATSPRHNLDRFSFTHLQNFIVLLDQIEQINRFSFTALEKYSNSKLQLNQIQERSLLVLKPILWYSTQWMWIFGFFCSSFWAWMVATSAGEGAAWAWTGWVNHHPKLLQEIMVLCIKISC